MRRLFIPFLALLVLAPLAACDSPQESPAVGEWELQRVETSQGDAVTGPIGSLLVFQADGTFRIESGNDCSGAYRSEFIVNEQILSFENASCTERATTLETGLELLLGVNDADVYGNGPMLYAVDPLRMDIFVFSPEATRTLVFEAR